MPVISQPFTHTGLTTGAKLLYFGAPGTLPADLIAEARSLKLEHVSPDALVHQEICRRTPLGQKAAQAAAHGAAVPDSTLLAIIRKWFWGRKPDAGFLLEGFPATLLHARIFDEWLEAREEALTGCLRAPDQSVDAGRASVVGHYRNLGLIEEPATASLSPA